MNQEGKAHVNFMADAVKAAAARKIDMEKTNPQAPHTQFAAPSLPRTADE